MERWDKAYREEGNVFSEPHPAIKKLIKLFKERKIESILDLGSGTGRNLVLLAENGFEVYGLDISPTGVEITKKLLMEKGLKAKVEAGNIYEPLPFVDGFFDAIISIQTLHHNTTEKIKVLIQEMERVLSSKGTIFVTVPSKMNQAEKFTLIEDKTYLPLDGREKDLPHHFFSRRDIRNLFSNFKIKEIYIDDAEHYAFLGIKK